jgi:hypothetical protein
VIASSHCFTGTEPRAPSLPEPSSFLRQVTPPEPGSTVVFLPDSCQRPQPGVAPLSTVPRPRATFAEPPSAGHRSAFLASPGPTPFFRCAGRQPELSTTAATELRPVAAILLPGERAPSLPDRGQAPPPLEPAWSRRCAAPPRHGSATATAFPAHRPPR